MAQYQPLDTTRNEIRLLHCRLGPEILQGACKIDCEFQIASLDDKPIYDALSYTWGQPNDWEDEPLEDQEIFMHGQAIKVTNNLFRALVAIQLECLPHPPAPLWVDAVCINQTDKAERSAQVRLMAELYSGARTVRIWLGVGGPQVESIFHAAEQGDIMALLNSDPETWLQGFRQIVSSSWWQRLWIVQEAVLATNATVHCGGHTVSWAKLISALILVRDESWMTDGRTPLLESMGQEATLSMMLLGRLFRETTQVSRRNRDLRYVLSLLSKLSKQKCSEEQDRVYGALGMLPESLGIVPDYDLKPLEVYRAFTLRLITWSNSLDILLLADSIDESDAWPSWIPGFRGGWLSVSYHEPLHAATGAAFPFGRVKNDTELAVRAHIVDTITFAQDFKMQIEDDFLQDTLVERYREFVKQCYEATVSPSGPLTIDPSDRRLRFWLTFRTQMPRHAVIPLEGATQLHLYPCSFLQELDDWLFGNCKVLSDEARSFVCSTQFGSSMVGFCASRKGYMATLTNQTPRVGDEIVLIAGCSRPMLLRPEETSIRKRYRVVGPCFCHELAYTDYVQQACRSKVQTARLPTALGGALEKCLHVIRVIHMTSTTYVSVSSFQETIGLLLRTASQILESKGYGGEHAGSKKILSTFSEDIGILVNPTERARDDAEAGSIAERLQSGFASKHSFECGRYLGILCETFATVYSNHGYASLLITLGLADGVDQQFEIREGLLSATGFIILQALICVARSEGKHLKLGESERGGGVDGDVDDDPRKWPRERIMGEAIQGVLDSRREEPVRIFYHELKAFAEDEVAAERLHNTLFDGLILV